VLETLVAKVIFLGNEGAAASNFSGDLGADEPAF
jgi:hypothetical protein